VKLFAAIGREVLAILEAIGALNITFYRVVRALIPPRLDREELWRQLHRIGVLSLPIVVMTAFLTGVIMVLQSMTYVYKTGATSFVGAGAGLAVLAELGPALIGLMFSGRVGANATAELGNMVVSEQIDALRALAIDPVKFLVAPRFVAIVTSLVMLTVVGDLFGLVGGAATAHSLMGIDWRTFVSGMLEIDLLDAFVVGLIKAFFFGVVISITSTTYGLAVRGGARGVGAAVNGCVVATALGIFLADYAITWAWINLLYG
jgi:phospholipid/cholesterol/gamma-HCH transport system permease protein